MKRIFVSLAFLGLLPTVNRADDGLSKETLAGLKQATVLVKGRLGDLSLTCTGFVIKTEGRTGYLVTSGDMFQLSRPAQGAAPRLSLVFDSGTPKQRTVRGEIALAEGLPQNLAVLRFKGTGEMPTTISLRQYAEPAETMTVYVLGFPFGEALAARKRGEPEITIIRASISKLVTERNGAIRGIQLEGSLNPGHIGSPVVDAHGKLVCAALGSIRGTRIAAAVPAERLAISLRPKVGPVALKPVKVGERSVTTRIEAPLRDPLGDLRSVSLLFLDSWDGRTLPPQLPDGSFGAVAGGRALELKIQGKMAVGSLVVDKVKIDDKAIGLHQVSQLDAQGTTYGVPTALRYAYLANVPTSARPTGAMSARAAGAARARRGDPAPASGGILQEQRRYGGHSGAVTDVAVAKDGRHTASSSVDETIRVLDLDSGNVVRTLKGHVGPVYCVDISPDARRVVSGGADRTVRIWDVSTGPELHCMAGHGGGVLDVAFSPDATRILSAGGGTFRQPKLSHEQAWQPEGDHSIKLWDAATGKLIQNMTGHTGMVRTVAFFKDNSKAVSASDDATVRIWDLETGKELSCDKHHTAGVFLAAFSKSSGGIVSAGHDGLIWMREPLDSGHERRLRFQDDPNGLSMGAINPDGRKVVIAATSWFLHNEGYLYVWDLGKGRIERVLHWGSGGNTRGTFLPDGGRVLWGSADGQLHLFRLPR